MNQDRIKELDEKLRAAQGITDEVKPAVGSTSIVFPENHLEEDPFENTEIGDEADQASRLERNFIAASLKAQQEAMKPETHPDFDGVHCIECDDEIPLLRLNMGKIYCVHCQEAREKLRKVRGY